MLGMSEEQLCGPRVVAGADGQWRREHLEVKMEDKHGVPVRP